MARSPADRAGLAMTTRARPHLPRITAAMRETEQVTPLELFFDLVFVLALTQCTQLMSDDPTWSGLAEGLLILALVWWSWVGYSWLTSVIDPEDDAVRVAMFVAMAGLLLVALCVPDAFGDLGLAFALSYGVVRAAHVWLFMIASRDEPGLRHSIVGFTVSTAIGVALITSKARCRPADPPCGRTDPGLGMGGPLRLPTFATDGERSQVARAPGESGDARGSPGHPSRALL
ncbi:MAG TPA: low temperature requirement protein A [Solirubrobacterales bacterium]|nr:low temperature requirement protein A [Solirubrobacterales bacterium]